MASSDSQIDKPQHERSKRAELPDVNINTGVQSINTEGLLKNSDVDWLFDLHSIKFIFTKIIFLDLFENLCLVFH